LVLVGWLSSSKWLAACPASAMSPQTVPPAAIQPLPGVAEAVNKGFDLLASHDAAGAEAAFRKAIDLQPELEMAHRGWGCLCGLAATMKRHCANCKWPHASTLRTWMRIMRWE